MHSLHLTAHSSRNSKEWLLLVGWGVGDDGGTVTNGVSLRKGVIYYVFCRLTFCTFGSMGTHLAMVRVQSCTQRASSWSLPELVCGPDRCDSCPSYPDAALPVFGRRPSSTFLLPRTVPSLFRNCLRLKVHSDNVHCDNPLPSQVRQASVFYWFLSKRRWK